MKAKFRQVDVTRALKAARAAGITVARYEIDVDGRIAIFSDVVHRTADAVAPAASAYDQWKAKHNGTTK
jgi:hypothetical protein